MHKKGVRQSEHKRFGLSNAFYAYIMQYTNQIVLHHVFQNDGNTFNNTCNQRISH